MADFDVIVLGAGPGGYVAAIRCAQLGLKTACVDDRVNETGEAALGGVCLNVGCIPSKALLDTSHHYHRAAHEFAGHGIVTRGLDIDVPTMMQRKRAVVKSLNDGVGMLFVKHKITLLKGHGRLTGMNNIQVTGHGGEEDVKEYSADSIIIATGSTPSELEIAPFDHDRVVDSTGALAFEEVPKRLGVIGGGVVGLELGSVWTRLGARTTVLVRGDTFLRGVEQQLAKAMYQELQAQGMNILLNARTKSVKVTSKQVALSYDTPAGEQKLIVDKLLVATGRKPNSQNIGTEVVGLLVNQYGFLEVDGDCRTNIPHIYAIGDVVRGPMLAHKASEEGMAVAERIAGQQPELNYAVIPSVIYTWPELAWVGRTSDELKSEGIEFKAGVFPFRGAGRGLASGDTTGMVKILSDKHSDRILGVHVFGPNASELIAEAVVAMEFSASAEDLARTVHAHPTMSEAMHEAALAVDGRAIHI